MPIRTIVAAMIAAVAVVAGAHARSGPTDCGKLHATHGRGATWRHYSAKIELDGTGATCDEARSVVAAWLDTDEPDQGQWFCQSSHGAASETFIGGCEHFPGGDLSAPPDATVTAAGSFDVAVAQLCAGSLQAYAIKCRVARTEAAFRL